MSKWDGIDANGHFVEDEMWWWDRLSHDEQEKRRKELLSRISNKLVDGGLVKGQIIVTTMPNDVNSGEDFKNLWLNSKEKPENY